MSDHCTDVMSEQVSVHFGQGRTAAQTSHDCKEITGVNLTPPLLVVQREALFKL